MVKNGKICKYISENVIWLMAYCFPKRMNVRVMMYKFISIEPAAQALVVLLCAQNRNRASRFRIQGSMCVRQKVFKCVAAVLTRERRPKCQVPDNQNVPAVWNIGVMFHAAGYFFANGCFSQKRDI